MINTDPHNKKGNGLVLVPTSQGEIMWLHPYLFKSQQWTTVINIKSKGKEKASACKICASSREYETDVASIINSEEEEIILTIE